MDVTQPSPQIALIGEKFNVKIKAKKIRANLLQCNPRNWDRGAFKGSAQNRWLLIEARQVLLEMVRATKSKRNKVAQKGTLSSSCKRKISAKNHQEPVMYR